MSIISHTIIIVNSITIITMINIGKMMTILESSKDSSRALMVVFTLKIPNAGVSFHSKVA